MFFSNLCFGQNNYWSSYFGGNGKEFCSGVVHDKQNNIYLFGTTDSSNNITTNGAHQVVYGGGIGDGILAKFDKYGNLLWSTYYGGNNDDGIRAACVDNNDNIIIAGISSSINNISTPGSFQATGPGGCFVAKFNSNGVRLWGTYFNYGAIRSVCTDKLGNIIFCGYTSDSSGLSTPGAYHPNNLGNYDGFLVKFGPNGNRLWGTYYGGNGNEDCFSCATDNSNNILISGYTHSDTGISTTGAAQINMDGVEDAYIAKFNSSGNILWSTYLGGNDYEDAYSVCADKNNNVIVGGSGISTNGIATPGAYKMLPDGQDAFIVKYDSNGVKKWGTYYGGPDNIDPDFFHQVVVNKSGEIFIVGNTTATTGIATAGSYRSSNSGYTDGYFAKFSPLGSLVWGSYFGGNIGGDVLGISIDSLSNIIIAGNTSSDSNIATNGAYQITYGGGISDCFIASFDSTGHIPPVGIQDFNEAIPSLLIAYPNPAKGKITVSIKDYVGNGSSLVLMNVEGKVVKSLVVKAEECNIDLKDLSAGVYLLQYEDGEVCETVKVVKE